MLLFQVLDANREKKDDGGDDTGYDENQFDDIEDEEDVYEDPYDTVRDKQSHDVVKKKYPVETRHSSVSIFTEEPLYSNVEQERKPYGQDEEDEEDIYEPITPNTTSSNKHSIPNRPVPPLPPSSPRPKKQEKNDEKLMRGNEKWIPQQQQFNVVLVKSEEGKVQVQRDVPYSPHSFIEGKDSVDKVPQKSPKVLDRNKQVSGKKKNRPFFLYASKPDDSKSVESYKGETSQNHKERSPGFEESIQSTLIKKPIPSPVAIADPKTNAISEGSFGGNEGVVVEIVRIAPGDSEYKTTPPALRQKNDEEKLKSLLGVHSNNRSRNGSIAKGSAGELTRIGEDERVSLTRRYKDRQQREIKARSEALFDDYQPIETVRLSQGWFSEIKPQPQQVSPTSSWRRSVYEDRSHPEHSALHPEHQNYNTKPSPTSSWRASSYEAYRDFDPDSTSDHPMNRSYRNQPSRSSRQQQRQPKKGLRRINSHQPSVDSHHSNLKKEDQPSTTTSSKVRGFFRAAKQTLKRNKSANTEQHYSPNRQSYFEQNIGDV